VESVTTSYSICIIRSTVNLYCPAVDKNVRKRTIPSLPAAAGVMEVLCANSTNSDKSDKES
jgi:hypothetical protein